MITKNLIDLELKLSEYQGEDKIVSSHDLAKELEKTKSAIRKFNMGFPAMDKILDGVEVGELIVVTGPTGEGKTSLLMSVTKNMAKAGINTAWFTLEVTPRQFIQKIAKSGNGLPLFYLPSKNTENHIKWLEERIIEAKVKYDVQAIFIDHIHQIFSLVRVQNNISLEIGDIVAKIKEIAIIHNLAIFLIAHSKDDPQNPAREPRKEDIRDSGLISRLADTIIGVWRIRNQDDLTTVRRYPLEKDDTKAKARIFKNRREGQLGAVELYHKDHYLTENAFHESGF